MGSNGRVARGKGERRKSECNQRVNKGFVNLNRLL